MLSSYASRAVCKTVTFIQNKSRALAVGMRGKTSNSQRGVVFSNEGLHLMQEVRAGDVVWKWRRPSSWSGREASLGRMSKTEDTQV